MKKILAIAAAALLAITSFAQDGKNIYRKYSEAENVSAVYISPAMFRMIGKLPDMAIGADNVNLTQVVNSLSGMYLIDSENPAINAGIIKDVEAFVKADAYEILMEAKDGGETTRIYTVGKGDTVNSFVLLTYGKNECTFICLEGDLTKQQLDELVIKSRK